MRWGRRTVRLCGLAGLALGGAPRMAGADQPPSQPSAPPPAGPPPAFETVVTAHPAPAAAPREDLTAAASVVVPDASPRAFDDLGGLLLEVPGVTVTRTGSLGSFSTLTLRGANPDEVRFYLDGVPLNIAAGGGVDISTLPLGDVARVEVYRGTTPLAFGQSALGGIVSLSTRTPGDARASARAGVGSFGTALGDLAAGGRAGRLRLYLGIHGLSSRGDYPYLNDNGTKLNTSDDVYQPRQNNDLRQADGTLRAAMALSGRRTLSLTLLGIGKDQGLPGRGGDPTVAARFRTARALQALRYESRDDLGAGGRLSVQAYASEQWDRLRDPNAELGLGGPEMTRDSTVAAGALVNASRALGDQARAALVLEGRDETYTPENDLAAVPVGLPARRLVGVAGAEVDLRVSRLDLDVVPSARLEAMSDLVSVRDTLGVPVAQAPIDRLLPVWRLGLARPLGGGAVLKANAGRYARAPSFLELYGNGAGRLLGNPDLAAERGTNADLALWVDRGAPRASISSRTTLFGALADDLIQWEYTPWGQGQAENIGRARIWGVEQELRLTAGRHARFVSQATYLVALDESDNAAAHGPQLPFHPRARVYARLEVARIALPAGLELGAYADGDLQTGTYADAINSQSFGTRLLVGAGLTVARPRDRVRLTASVANLTDFRGEDGVDWALPGRCAFVTLAYAPVGAPGETGPGGPDPSFDPANGP